MCVDGGMVDLTNPLTCLGEKILMNDFWCASYEFFCLSNFLLLEFILVFFYLPIVLLTYFFIYHVILLLMMSYLFIEMFKYPHLPFT